jgi:ABC-2 type transport system ATP-binding protein
MVASTLGCTAGPICGSTTGAIRLDSVDVVIECRNLSKQFGGRKAVDDLSFDVHPGVVTGFLGPNGAGKSTTLRLILNLDRGGGLTRFDGCRYVDLPDPIRQVGAVLEARDFHPGRTARNHLRMLAAGGGVAASRVDEVLHLVGLGDVGDRRPGGFSLGMGQRLGLATALLGDPGTIILDEPGNGLDAQGARWLQTLLRRFAAEGRTVLVSSHHLAQMQELADELVVIGQGRLVAQSTVQDFIRRSGSTDLEEAFLAATHDAEEFTV